MANDGLQALCEWARAHLGVAVEMHDEPWQLEEVVGGRCLLSWGGLRRSVPVRSVFYRWMKQNTVPDTTVN